MLTYDIPNDAGSRMDYVLPRRLGVLALATLILENSPKSAQGHEKINLVKISCKGTHRDKSGDVKETSKEKNGRHGLAYNCCDKSEL